LPRGNAVFQKKATELIDYSCPITDQARTHVQRLQIQLVVSLNRHTTRRRALHGFRNRMGVSIVPCGLAETAWNKRAAPV
jgi:hypothetical protein